MALDRVARIYKEKINLSIINCIPRQLTPNQLTFIGFIFGLLSAIFCSQNQYFLAIICWTLNRFIDGIDGTYARHTNRASEYGGYLDIVFDFIIYCFIPLGIAYQKDEKFIYLVSIYMISTYTVNAVCQFFLSAILEQKNTGAKDQGEFTTVTFPAALIEGTETVVFYFLFLLFDQYISILFTLFSFLVTLNVLQRLKDAYNILEKREEKKQ